MKNYYAFINNTAEGPWSPEEIQEQLRNGLLTGSTLIAEAGGTDWMAAAEVFPEAIPLAVKPPPLPVVSRGGPSFPQPRVGEQNPYAPPSADLQPPMLPMAGNLDFPLAVDGRTIPGTEGLTARQVVDMVQAGGRFVVWRFNFSVLVLSFKRSSSVRFLRPGESGALSCFGYSCISAGLGWWGFPWGIIWTPLCLFRNMAGGQDLTEPILASFIGPGEADRIVRQRPKASPWPAAFAALAPVLVVVLFFAAVISAAPASRSRTAARRGSSSSSSAPSGSRYQSDADPSGTPAPRPRSSANP